MPKQPTTEAILSTIPSLDTKDLITIKDMIIEILDERKQKAKGEYDLINNGKQ